MKPEKKQALRVGPGSHVRSMAQKQLGDIGVSTMKSPSCFIVFGDGDIGPIRERDREIERGTPK